MLSLRASTTRSVSASALLLVAFAGAATGVAIVVGDVALLWLTTGDCTGRTVSGTSFTTAHCEFVRSPASVMWFAIVAMHNALWAVLLVPLGRVLRELRPRRHARGSLRAAGLTMLVMMPPAILWGLLVTPQPLAGQGSKMLSLAAFAAAVALAGAVGIWRVEEIAAELSRKPSSDTTDLRRYLRLRRLLERLIGVEGALLGSVVVGTAAFQRAVAATGPEARDGFPPEYVLVYGAYFSGLLALVYVSTYWRLHEVGERLRNRFVDVSDPGDPGWPDAFGRWKDLGEFLRLDATATTSARVSLAIAAPLATSVISTLL